MMRGGDEPGWKPGLEKHEIRLRGFPRAAWERGLVTVHACTHGRASRGIYRRMGWIDASDLVRESAKADFGPLLPRIPFAPSLNLDL